MKLISFICYTLEVDDKIVGFYYQWDRFEEKNGIDIIDFNLIQQQDKYPGEFKSREEVKESLITLIQEYDSTQNKNTFISSKLNSSQYFLRALMGDQIPFSEYVLNTVGIAPFYIREEEVQAQLEVAKSLYKELGYEYTKEDLDRFTKDNKLSKEEIEKSFTVAKDIFVPKVLDWLGLDVNLRYETKFVDVNEYWMNWTSTDDQGNLLLRFNLNERNAWKKGFPDHLALHEICGHAIQASSWRQQINSGKLSFAGGLTTVFTPEGFMSEGIAYMFSWFYPEELFSIDGKLATNAIYLYWLTWNNAHIMINQDKPMEEVLSYLDDYMPGYETEQTRRENLLMAKTNPLYRQYLYVNGIGCYYHKQLAQKLSVEAKRDYVKDIYTNLYTPGQIIDKYKLT